VVADHDPDDGIIGDVTLQACAVLRMRRQWRIGREPGYVSTALVTRVATGVAELFGCESVRDTRGCARVRSQRSGHCEGAWMRLAPSSAGGRGHVTGPGAEHVCFRGDGHAWCCDRRDRGAQPGCLPVGESASEQEDRTHHCDHDQADAENAGGNAGMGRTSRRCHEALVRSGSTRTAHFL
jgi:hypothetical protein